MKRTSLAIALLAVFLLPASALAFTVKTDNSVYIGKGETVDGNLYAAGSNITIDGVVTGDLICASQSVTVNGKVEGDVICVGQNLNIRGQVGGSVRAAGNTINIDGQVSRQLMAFGAAVNLGASSTIGWDAFVVGGTLESRGVVRRDLYGAAGQAVISGDVGKNVRLRLDSENKMADEASLVVEKGATITGDLVYTDKNEARIEDNAQVIGKTVKNDPILRSPRKSGAAGRGWGVIYSIFASLAIGLVLVALWKRPMNGLVDEMKAKPWESIIAGFIVLIVGPILAILLMFTFIGIPLAIAYLFAYIIALLLGKVFTALLLGKYIISKTGASKEKDQTMLSLVAGVAALGLVAAIPYVGGLVSFIALIWGLGGIVMAIRHTMRA